LTVDLLPLAVMTILFCRFIAGLAHFVAELMVVVAGNDCFIAK